MPIYSMVHDTLYHKKTAPLRISGRGLLDNFDAQRTPNPLKGRGQKFYHRVWREAELNRRPSGYESDALTF